VTYVNYDSGHDLITTYVSADVAAGGTIEFTYPDDRQESDYAPTGADLGVAALQTVITQESGAVTLSFGVSSVTVTYVSGATIPAFTRTTLQLATLLEGPPDGYAYVIAPE
jgi:hypothetical protein